MTAVPVFQNQDEAAALHLTRPFGWSPSVCVSESKGKVNTFLLFIVYFIIWVFAALLSDAEPPEGAGRRPPGVMRRVRTTPQ